MIGGLLVLVAGAALLLSGLGALTMVLAHEVAGVTLALYGLSGLAHAANMCPNCKGKCC